jgi:DNA-binding LytR/AlgR family response regulator
MENPHTTITFPAEQPPQAQLERPSDAEIAAGIEEINRNRSPGVYRSNPNAADAQPEDRQPEKLDSAEVATRIGSVVVKKAVGMAVGMASLPEKYAGQQLEHFDFTAAQYAAQRIQAEQIRQLASQPASESHLKPKGSRRKRKAGRRSAALGDLLSAPRHV